MGLTSKAKSVAQKHRKNQDRMKRKKNELLKGKKK